jgi:hypothetical protein
LKSDLLTTAPESARVTMDHRDSRIESPSEAIDPPSASRSVISAWAEQIRPLLLDPAIIAEPAGSVREAVSRSVETSEALLHRAASNLDPDGQEHRRPSLYQSQWQTNPEVENLSRFTSSESEAASFPDPINDLGHIHLPFYSDSVSGSYRLGASVAAEGWTQADLSRFTGMHGNWADVTAAEPSIHDPVRAQGLKPVPAADRPQRGPANVTLLLAGLESANQGQSQDEGQRRTLSLPGALFPWADGGADGLFAATVSPSIPRARPFEMGREADTVAGDLRDTTGPMPETRTGDADQPWQSRSGQDTAESDSLGNLASRLAAAAERLEQVALRLASQAPPLAAAPRPFQGRVDA